LSETARSKFFGYGRLNALEVEVGDIIVKGGTGARIEKAQVIRPCKAGAINAGEPPPNSANASIRVYLRGIASFAGDFAPSVHEYGFGKPLWLFRFQGGEAVVDRIAASLADLRVEHALPYLAQNGQNRAQFAPAHHPIAAVLPALK
jgi:hypothetical protein